MKKRTLTTFAVLSATLFVALLPIMMIPMVRAPWQGYPYPDIESACDHMGTFGAEDDTFTGIGVVACYGWEPPAYVHGEWYYERGYGGDYPATGTMTCYRYYTPHWYIYRDPPDFKWECRYVPGHQDPCCAYYHDEEYTNYNIPRSSQIVGCTGSYFEDPNPPYDEWHITSCVSVTAGYP